MKRICAVIFTVVLLLSLTGCAANPYEAQFQMPKKGDTIAVIHTNYGDITVRFFPKEAPKAVENFITLAKNGYYDGVIFHRVIADFMIQAGDPTGTGRGGESAFGSPFENENVSHLSPYRGALCMANAGTDGTNTSQFFIVTDEDKDVKRVENANTMVEKSMRVDKRKIEQYKKHGGALWLDYEISAALSTAFGSTPAAHTVFGQVIDGMDVADAISKVEVYSEMEMKDANIDEPGQTKVLKDKPKEDVVIESVEIKAYGE